MSVAVSCTELPIRTSRFAGTRVLLGPASRAERVIAPTTVLLFLMINAATAGSIVSMYPEAADRVALQQGPGANAAFRFLLGPLQSVESTAAITVWRAGLFMIAAFAVCVALAVTRHTRRDEEQGRVEMVRAGATGRLAPIATATIVAVVYCVVVGLAMSLMLIPLGAGAIDVVCVFAQYATTGMAAAGVALVAAQVATTAHLANLTATAMVLGGYVLRGAADIVDGWGWLRWLSPVGWAELIDPFGADDLWWAGASILVFVLAVGLAGVVAERRDLGAGLLAPRPGPASTTRLADVGAVAVRLLGSQAVAWTVAIAVYALVVGAIAPSVDELAEGNQLFADVVGAAGVSASLGALFTSTMSAFLAVAASAWSVAVISRLRSEESAGRVEVLLATPTSRSRLYLAHVAVAVGGVVAILVATTLGLGVGTAAAGGDAGSAFADAARATAVQLPAATVIVGSAMLLYGLAPRSAPAGWLVVLGALLLGPLAGMFQLPQWVRDISPFTHTPTVPLEPVRGTPLIVMLVVAVGLIAVGRAAFDRRDVG
ncbi:ABC transporter permease [Gordonia soli]|uniref:Putative ABC transporter permease protein n=1 Tax=Gordonia soli NBRC 108243 TaxID=1223545 RepID=M0QIB9_9ACTN|nr:hypothetical protein [Gordonia soli]GAC68293.1 putative ABC transporter permease protein [Gordonia soli NBRC 108243]